MKELGNLKGGERGSYWGLKLDLQCVSEASNMRLFLDRNCKSLAKDPWLGEPKRAAQVFVLLQVESAQEKQGEDLGEAGELCVLRVMTLKLKCLR